METPVEEVSANDLLFNSTVDRSSSSVIFGRVVMTRFSTAIISRVSSIDSPAPPVEPCTFCGS